MRRGDGTIPDLRAAEGKSIGVLRSDAAYNGLVGFLSVKERGICGLVAGPPVPDDKRVFAFGLRKGDRGLARDVESVNRR